MSQHCLAKVITPSVALFPLVQWLVYLPVTQVTGVRFPDGKSFLLLLPVAVGQLIRVLFPAVQPFQHCLRTSSLNVRAMYALVTPIALIARIYPSLHANPKFRVLSCGGLARQRGSQIVERKRLPSLEFQLDGLRRQRVKPIV